jgi:hypothetical protein
MTSMRMTTTAAITRTTPPSFNTRASSLLTTPSANATKTALLPVVQHDLNHPTVQPAIHAVLESWKQCRNSLHANEFDETFGKLLLIRLFNLEPRLKLFFGFHMSIDPTATSLGEMALILSAVRLTQQLNQVLDMVSR